MWLNYIPYSATLQNFIAFAPKCIETITQNQVAAEMDVTPGYISNVENGRTAMSLRFLIYYAKLMGVTLDELVGTLEPEYTSNALENALMAEISKMDDAKKEKLLKTIKIWK